MTTGGLLPANLTTEEGFVDIALPIVESIAGDGGLSLVVKGEFDGRRIGFAFDLFPEWKAQPTDDASATFYWGKARFRSLGSESDAFIAMLAHAYGLETKTTPMASQISVNAVGLGMDPRTVLKSPVRMKCFFDSGPEDRYAEVFTHIDLGGGHFYFNEKDMEYRLPLVRSLQDGA